MFNISIQKKMKIKDNEQEKEINDRKEGKKL